MTRTRMHPSWLAVVAAATLLAGCATTDSTYSSLPPAPEHPGPKAPMDRATVTIPGSFSTAREVPHLPPEQYTDLLDRIDRHEGTDDYRYTAMKTALPILLADRPDRVEFLDDRVVLFTSVNAKPLTFRYALRATTAGTFGAPALQGACMYEPAVAALGESGQVEIGR